MCTIEQMNIITRSIAQAYKDIYGDALNRVMLYGSVARGDQKDDSDVDMVAIVEGDRLDLQNKLKKVWEMSNDLGLEYEMLISPAVIPQKEYDRYKNDLPYYANIENEGVVLYERQPH